MSSTSEYIRGGREVPDKARGSGTEIKPRNSERPIKNPSTIGISPIASRADRELEGRRTQRSNLFTRKAQPFIFRYPSTDQPFRPSQAADSSRLQGSILPPSPKAFRFRTRSSHQTLQPRTARVSSRLPVFFRCQDAIDSPLRLTRSPAAKNHPNGAQRRRARYGQRVSIQTVTHSHIWLCTTRKTKIAIYGIEPSMQPGDPP